MVDILDGLETECSHLSLYAGIQAQILSVDINWVVSQVSCIAQMRNIYDITVRCRHAMSFNALPRYLVGNITSVRPCVKDS